MTTWEQRNAEIAQLEAYEQERETSKLKPAQRLRQIVPRVCGFCRDGRQVAGVFICIRPDGFSCDAATAKQWTWTCDRWRPLAPGSPTDPPPYA